MADRSARRARSWPRRGLDAIRRFRQLSRADRRVVATALVLVPAIRAALAVLPFRVVLRAILELGRPSGRRSGFDADRVVWATQVVGRRLARRKPCLTEALVVMLLFRRAGRPVRLRIGVTRSGDDKLRAHAWVEEKGAVLIGGRESIDEYVPLKGTVEADDDRVAGWT